MASSNDNASRIIVHTKTESNVLNLPSISVECDYLDPEILNKVECFVTDSHETVIIEHMCLLTDESSIRSMIQLWKDHESKDLLLLIVDMSNQNSHQNANFVRSCVEEENCIDPKKKFIALLHYPPSTANLISSYPVLFLNDWQHICLDSIGSAMSKVSIKNWIRASCISASDFNTDQISELFPKVILSLTSRLMFYPGQEKMFNSNCNPSIGYFQVRLKVVKYIMNYKLQDATIGDILNDKFKEMWTSNEIRAILERLCQNILHGRSQLSMGLSMLNVLQESFTLFLHYHLHELNTCRNLDILESDKFDGSSKNLFALIIEQLPVPPLQELLLSSQHKNLEILPTSYPMTTRFPFFHLIHKFLNEVTETVFKEQHADENTYSSEEMFAKAVGLFSGAKYISSSECLRSRKNAVVIALEMSKENKSLFFQYLHHFMIWKFGEKSQLLLMRWMSYQVRQLSELNSEANCHILSIHVLAKYHELDLIRFASLMTPDAQLLDSEPIDGNINDSFDLNNESVLHATIKQYEKALFDESKLILWSQSFSSFLNISLELSHRKSITDTKTLRLLRALCFMHILVKSKLPFETVRRLHQKWYCKRTRQIVEDVVENSSETSMELFFDFMLRSISEYRLF